MHALAAHLAVVIEVPFMAAAREIFASFFHQDLSIIHFPKYLNGTERAVARQNKASPKNPGRPTETFAEIPSKVKLR